jgi:hypothetical protein
VPADAVILIMWFTCIQRSYVYITIFNNISRILLLCEVIKKKKKKKFSKKD